MRPLSEMLEHEIANEKLRLINLPESEQTEETENRLEEILDWEAGISIPYRNTQKDTTQ